jgi:hypothetical protein
MTFVRSRVVLVSLGLLALVLTASGPALAYIGPGAGITVLGALWGVIVAVALAVGAVLFWPIRMVARRLRRPKPTIAKVE